MPFSRPKVQLLHNFINADVITLLPWIEPHQWHFVITVKLVLASHHGWSVAGWLFLVGLWVFGRALLGDLLDGKWFACGGLVFWRNFSEVLVEFAHFNRGLVLSRYLDFSSQLFFLLVLYLIYPISDLFFTVKYRIVNYVICLSHR